MIAGLCACRWVEVNQPVKTAVARELSVDVVVSRDGRPWMLREVLINRGAFVAKQARCESLTDGGDRKVVSASIPEEEWASRYG